MPRRTLAAAAVTTSLLVVSCSSSPPSRTDPPPPAPRPSTTGDATSATATRETTATATPTPGTVPVDQIPPGRPASWIPAGVTTIAPWKEPGDVLPRFTLAMFDDDATGALAAASYYVDARNWAFATLDPTAFLLLCQSEICKENGQRFQRSAALHEHIVGARHDGASPQLRSAPGTSAATWIVRWQVTIKAGSRLAASGKILQTQRETKQINDLYMRWSGSRWLVQDDVLGR